jgi:precorrin-6A/cobalt-precorrin-6A reductase
MPRRVLLLGGTTEATELAAELAKDGQIELIVSLAGRTARPLARNGQLRTGGFGGADGLARYLADETIALVVDATHPFAAVMPFNAAAACLRVGVPLLKICRPAWTPAEGDRWTSVADLHEAAATLVARGARQVLLTTGRQELDPFRGLRRITFFVRSIEPPDLRGFDAATAVVARGPFDLNAERALLSEHAIDTLVSKNSGGAATSAKLEAARELRIDVVMVRRPAAPEVALVDNVAEARSWISGRLMDQRGVKTRSSKRSATVPQ